MAGQVGFGQLMLEVFRYGFFYWVIYSGRISFWICLQPLKYFGWDQIEDIVWPEFNFVFSACDLSGKLTPLWTYFTHNAILAKAARKLLSNLVHHKAELCHTTCGRSIHWYLVGPLLFAQLSICTITIISTKEMFAWLELNYWLHGSGRNSMSKSQSFSSLRLALRVGGSTRDVLWQRIIPVGKRKNLDTYAQHALTIQVD